MIFNGSKNHPEASLAIAEHSYRKMYGLSHRELLDEPSSKFLLNVTIESLLREKKEREMKHG